MPQSEALVTATYSRRMRLRLADGRLVDARIKGKKLKPVCGDRIVAEPIENESDWLITAVLERRNQLSRPNMRGGIEVLAANIELLIVVAAASPKPDWYIVDRYLCAAENIGASAAVVFNKTDIAEPDSNFADYERIGYPAIRLSAKAKINIDALQNLLAARTAIIVGQSGVGKSSIINAMLGEQSLRTAAISTRTREGKHTTVNSEMLDIGNGAAVIDSPGVRDFAPAIQESRLVMQGFREIDNAAQHCRFANCRHLREPGCAVKDALETQGISARRYESYRRLLALTEKLEKQL